MNNASHRNPPVNNPIPTSPPPGYDARPLPMEGMLGSASSNQSGPRRFHSNFGGAPLREETNYAGRSGPEPQPEARPAYNESRNPTPLSNNEIHDSHRRAHRVPNFMPQDFQVREPPSTTGHGLHQPGTQVRDVRPGTSDDYVPDNHEALGTGHRRQLLVVERKACTLCSKPRKDALRIRDTAGT
ncbi:hypothetical protein BYT27DRAFT_7185222 [Phlegmacium glaucopus]|nr:hypothetical protein BYT27DRAFT_7185222 [Phlegmacium glaucopus]